MKQIKRHGYMVLISIVVLFFIGFQTHELIGLSEGYLGEQVDGSILPFYALVFCTLPLILIMGVWAPGKAFIMASLPQFGVRVKQVYSSVRDICQAERVDVVINIQKTLQVVRC